MIEKEKIEYARSFIEKMANGINPLDDSPIPEDDLLNNVRVSRCLFYVSDVLLEYCGILEQPETVEGEAVKPKKEKKIRLPKLKSDDLTNIDFSTFPISDKPVTPAVFKNLFKEFLAPFGKRMSSDAISNWLLQQGYLEISVETNSEGKTTNRRVVTEKGNGIGLATATRQTAHGILYRTYELNKNAQMMVIDNLALVLECEPAQESVDNWSNNDVDYLKRYAKYVGVQRAAIMLGRDVEEVRAKLDELGIVIE